MVLSLGCAPWVAHAEPMREFVMSCSYGVLAGTIVGAASLAFTDKPGENLNKIARGASIGLYSGILLGFYVVYGVPEEGGVPPEEDPALQNVRLGLPRINRLVTRSLPTPPLQIVPLLSSRGIDGAQIQYAIMRF